VRAHTSQRRDAVRCALTVASSRRRIQEVSALCRVSSAPLSDGTLAVMTGASDRPEQTSATHGSLPARVQARHLLTAP
jgi:hypothetical protein